MSACCSQTCEILLWKNPVQSGKILGAALLAIIILKNLKFTHILSLTYKVAFTFAVINLVSDKVVKYQAITKYVQPNKCPNIVGFVKPRIDNVLVNLPGYQLQFRKFLFAETPLHTIKLCSGLYIAVKLLNALSITTILLIAVLGAFSLPLAYNKNQKVIDENISKYHKLAVEKLNASPLKPYLEKLNQKAAPAKKSDEEPVVVSESAAKTTAEEINAKIDTATSTAFEK